MRTLARKLIPLFFLAVAAAPGQPVTGKPGVFDYYLFTLSWSPEFCHSHPTNVECAVGKHYAFIVHGLWPQFNNNQYPQTCSTQPGPTNTAYLKDTMPDPSLIRHEWTTHGTCSGLTPDAYFHLIQATFQSIHIPTPFVAPTKTVSVAPGDVKQAFIQANPKISSGGIAVNCPGNFLTAVQICVSKSGSPIACPAGAVRDCRAKSIRVPPVP